VSKTFIRTNQASGSTRHRVFELLNRCGRYSPRRLAKRQQRIQQREAGR